MVIYKKHLKAQEKIQFQMVSHKDFEALKNLQNDLHGVPLK